MQSFQRNIFGSFTSVNYIGLSPCHLADALHPLAHGLHPMKIQKNTRKNASTLPRILLNFRPVFEWKRKIYRDFTVVSGNFVVMALSELFSLHKYSYLFYMSTQQFNQVSFVQYYNKLNEGLLNTALRKCGWSYISLLPFHIIIICIIYFNIKKSKHVVYF